MPEHSARIVVHWHGSQPIGRQVIEGALDRMMEALLDAVPAVVDPDIGSHFPTKETSQ